MTNLLPTGPSTVFRGFFPTCIREAGVANVTTSFETQGKKASWLISDIFLHFHDQSWFKEYTVYIKKMHILFLLIFLQGLFTATYLGVAPVLRTHLSSDPWTKISRVESGRVTLRVLLPHSLFAAIHILMRWQSDTILENLRLFQAQTRTESCTSF